MLFQDLPALRNLFGAESKSEALESTARVKAYLWENVPAKVLGISLSEAVTFNLEAHICNGTVALISVRQMNGANAFVNHLIDGDTAFSLVQALTGPFSRGRWDRVPNNHDSQRLTRDYFLKGKGLFWFDVLTDFRDLPEKGWCREIIVADQERIIYGIVPLIPDYADSFGGKLTR
ncbi:MAG: hypothetical protein P4L99_25590 [Chthoniobacter sp.]|nr:hypothetical protein [Chthoniobacter sp.]